MIALTTGSSRPLPLRGVRAIEIGAGLGVVGLTAALLGANVVLTDLPAVLPGLQRNVEVRVWAAYAPWPRDPLRRH